MKLRRMSASVLIMTTILLMGCDRTESDWKQAKDANTVAAYANFIAKHPQGPHVDEANAATESLEWNAAEGSGSPDAFLDFYNRHPATTRFQKMTGDIVSSPVLPFGNGIGFAISGNVPVGAASVSIAVGGHDLDIHPSAEDGGRLGLIEYRPDGGSVFVSEKTLKDATLLLLPGADGKLRIVAVKTSGH
jgi:hypothetical protein